MHNERIVRLSKDRLGAPHKLHCQPEVSFFPLIKVTPQFFHKGNFFKLKGIVLPHPPIFSLFWHFTSLQALSVHAHGLRDKKRKNPPFCVQESAKTIKVKLLFL